MVWTRFFSSLLPFWTEASSLHRMAPLFGSTRKRAERHYPVKVNSRAHLRRLKVYATFMIALQMILKRFHLDRSNCAILMRLDPGRFERSIIELLSWNFYRQTSPIWYRQIAAYHDKGQDDVSLTVRWLVSYGTFLKFRSWTLFGEQCVFNETPLQFGIQSVCNTDSVLLRR